MSEVDATKPVEAEQPEVAPAAETVEKPTEEKPAEDKTEDKTEEKTEASEKSENKSESNILKTTAKIDRENYSNNRKFDPSTREVTDDPNAIRKQVEFYFGDWNFPQDKFMWESAGGSENKPIKVKTIHSFKRMRTFQPYSAVVAALKDSTFLDISGEEGEEEIKRKVPYQPGAVGKSKVDAASVYVKGFGDETPDTQFELESWFAQFGETKGIKLRRTNENLFKGSVFVTFADEETAKKFLEQDPKPQWKGHDLKIMSKRAYCDEKSDLIRQGKIEPSATGQKKFFEGRDGGKNSRGRGRGGRGGFDQDDWKKRRDHDQKHGFKDRRGGRGGRGGRGRGRGGRDRDDRRDRDERKERENGEVKHSSNGTMPRIQSTADEGNNNGKRARDEDATAGEPAAKKVDTKEVEA